MSKFEDAFKRMAERTGRSVEELRVQMAYFEKDVPARTKDCPTIEDLDEYWPDPAPHQRKHLESCGFCQRLIACAFPVLYIGPGRLALSREAMSDKTLNWLIADWRNKGTSDCVNETSVYYFSMNDLELEHAMTCGNCHQLVNAFMRCLGPIANRADSASVDYFWISKVRQEIGWARDLCENHAGCLAPLTLGSDEFFPLYRYPKFEEWRKHLDGCVHCQVIYQCYRLRSSWRCGPGRCLDLKSWQMFPVFHPEDQESIWQHIADCEACSSWAPRRLKINALRDRAIFQKALKQPGLIRSVRTLVREKIKRPIGDFVSSWRFHFSSAGPFSRRHDWAIWNDQDRMLKLAGGDDRLSKEEVLYWYLLNNEESPESAAGQLAASLPKYDPKEY